MQRDGDTPGWGHLTLLGYTVEAEPTRPWTGLMLKRLVDFLNEYLRINAIRRMLGIVEVRPTEIVGLVGFAVLFAAFEGIGLSLLLPILQFAEGGSTAITDSPSVIWQAVSGVMQALHLPLTLPVLLAMAFTPILLRQVVFYLNAWYSAVVSNRITIRLRMDTLRTVMQADPEFFARRSVGDLVGVIMSQTGAAGAAILAVIRQVSIALLMLLYVAILFAISVPLTLTVIAFSLVVSFAVKRSLSRTRDFGLEAARISQAMMAKIVERMSLMRLIKLRNQEQAEEDRVEAYSERMCEIGVKQAKLSANIEVTADPLLMLSVFVTLYVGISLLGMTLAQLGLLIFVLSRLNAKLKEFNAGRQSISANIAGLIVVQETRGDAVASNRIRGGSLPFAGLHEELVLEHVGFAYPGFKEYGEDVAGPETPVLRDISVSIPAGSFTAIVGRSGAGKSTLAELLPRLRDATEGTIRYDGIDIKEYDVGSLRKGIGYLTQSAMLFHDTVRANLTYGLGHEPTDEEIATALEQAYATFVYDREKGIDGIVGERGSRFSGGECQRLGLARVLLEDTSVIVLDEPTSALDSESEGYIQKALRELHGKKTIIVIAHRLATVVQADQLLVVEDGCIVETGTHDELVSHDGPYHKLFQTQLIS